MREVQSLFKRLAKCPPPGCKYQKYLRWLQGSPADSDIVRRVLVGVSMLPASFREMTEIVHENDDPKICFTKRSKIILHWLFNHPDSSYSRGKLQKQLEKFLETEKPIGTFFNLRKFKIFMEYVMGDDKDPNNLSLSKRLRLLMAEYYQISCRGLFEHADAGFLNWTRPSKIVGDIDSTLDSPDDISRTCSRQMGALLHLIMLNNQSTQIRFWA